MGTKLKFVSFDAVNTILKVNHDSVFQYAKAAQKFGVAVCEDKLRHSYE